MKLRRDDLVVVVSGNFKGQGPAKISSIALNSNRAIVEGVSSALKHVKKGHPKSPQGGRVTIPVAIDVSNLAIFCQNCNRGVRVNSVVIDGRKVRVCRRSGCNKAL